MNAVKSGDSRTMERIRVHYEVERELAVKLRASKRHERSALFSKLYQELFDRVPDHPRLTRRISAEASAHNVEKQWNLIRPFLKPEGTFVEIAPGDCRLSYRVCREAAQVIGIDISDQRSSEDVEPQNFELKVYDGYHLNMPSDVADVMFSYQFLEHLHPEDVPLHFELARKLLKPGGWYIFDTPHRLSGPHDVSRFFGRKLDCFHFQEWTYAEMIKLLQEYGFGSIQIYRFGKPWGGCIALTAVKTIESIFGLLSPLHGSPLSHRLFPAVTVAAQLKS